MANFYGSYVGFGGGGTAGASFVFQGESYGYRFGFWIPPASANIERFSFASGDSATVSVHAALSSNRAAGGCHKSATYGYCSGGRTSWPTELTTIDKHEWSTSNDSTECGVLTEGKSYGYVFENAIYGYWAGEAWGSA